MTENALKMDPREEARQKGGAHQDLIDGGMDLVTKNPKVVISKGVPLTKQQQKILSHMTPMHLLEVLIFNS